MNIDSICKNCKEYDKQTFKYDVCEKYLPNWQTRLKTWLKKLFKGANK